MVASLPPHTHTHTHTQLSSVEQLEPRALLAGLTGGFAPPLAATVPPPTGGDRDAGIVLADPARPETAGIGTAVVPFQVTPLVLTGAQAAPTTAPAVQLGTVGDFQFVPVGEPGDSGGFAPDVDPWAPGGLLPGWEYQVWQEIGLLPLDGLEAPGVADASERPPKSSGAADDDPLAFALDPKTGKLWGYGPRVEGGNAKQAFGQVGGRVNGVLKEVGVIAVTEGAPVVAGYWWFTRRGGQAVSAIGDGSKAILPPTKPLGYTRMQEYIKELGVPSLPTTARLTPQQIFAIHENLQLVIENSLSGYRELIARGAPRAEVLKGLQLQLNQLRWRFIDQVPGGREAIQGILQEFPEVTFPY